MRVKILFLIILVVAIFVRFYKLGSLPSGLTWDEAAIGYNAYGLITNHRDEWLKRMPLVFASFGDFKSPLLIYLSTIPIFTLGLTSFALRLPNALAGVGLVMVSYFLAKRVTKNESASLAVMALVACSPWAIHYSRMGFESMIACFLIVTGAYAWLEGIVAFAHKKNTTGLIYWVLGDGLMAASLYAYHSSKVFVPMLIVILGIVYGRDFLREKKALLIGSGVFVLLLLPLGYASILGKANARALTTTIITAPDPVKQFVRNYADHLSLAFLLRGDDITYRHSTRSAGVIYPIELALFLLGLALIVWRQDYRRFWWIPTLFFVGLVPAALGVDTPHSNRALLAFPWLTLVAGIGLVGIGQWTNGYRQLRVGTWMLLVGVLIFCVSGYFGLYQETYRSSVALGEVGYGYEELISIVRPLESEVERVYFTNNYGQAYIYLLFFKRLTPMEYQHGGLSNYTITNDPWKEAQGKKNVLVVGTDKEIPKDATVLKEIRYPDGRITFKVVKL